MASRTLIGRGFLLLLAGGFCMALTLPAGAQAEKQDAAGPAVAATATDDEADEPEAKEADVTEAEVKPVDPNELDWSQIDLYRSTLTTSKAPRSAKASQGGDTSWSSNNKANGSAAVSVKQALTPFWDTRIGADMNVINQPQTLTGSDLLRQKVFSDSQPSQSSGTAWAAITAPGVGSLWDKTAVEARVDPSQEQSKLGTSLSKSLPLSEQTSLTLQNDYNVIQQGIVPVPGIPGRPARNTQTDQSAKLSIADSGTSFVASQSLSSSDDKWLRKIGAEQKLFSGVSISGSIGETSQGVANKSLTAGFKQSW